MKTPVELTQDEIEEVRLALTYRIQDLKQRGPSGKSFKWLESAKSAMDKLTSGTRVIVEASK